MMDSQPSLSPPTLRPYNSTPSPSPALAIPSYKPTERSVSAGSVESATSRCSSVSRSSDAVAARRRGYARPQATNFADSARNRESVLSLGTIAHLQYYFARTGLLDGKGAQLYTGKTKTEAKQSPIEEGLVASNYLSAPKRRSDSDSTYSSMRSSPDIGLLPEHGSSLDGNLMESPIQDDLVDSYDAESGAPMLPPTVSTYNHRPKHVPRLPNMDEMRRDVRDTLADATKVLEDAAKEEIEVPPASPSHQTIEAPREHASRAASSIPVSCLKEPSDEDTKDIPSTSTESQGWHEVQGMHILDLMTLAIRAAKIYYTAHEQPGKLSAIRSERKIREDLLTVMDTLKRMASRNFSGGLRKLERLTMQGWIDGVQELLAHEEEQERRERRERESWVWMTGDWSGREREREWVFLKSFDPSPDVLPPWPTLEVETEVPGPFLLALQNGIRLIKLHNEMTAKSRRPFGQVSTFHTDTTKPYRCADNLRYWIKAVELRWEIVLKFDVMGVVYGREVEAWKTFDGEVQRWCGHVREAFSREWKENLVREGPAMGPESNKSGTGVHWEETGQGMDSNWVK